MKTFIISVVGFIALAGIALPRSASAEAKYIIKFAAIAPEGSSWMKIIHELDNELQARTKGELALKIYAGGVAGDEKDVLRKIRIGQMNGGGFTGIGLGEIVPAVRLFELPLLFKDYKEVDALTAALRPDMAKQFEEKGFVLLGWSEAGFAYVMSKKPVEKREDLSGVKMWMWEGDPLGKAMFQALNIVPVPLALTDVLLSLQTGIIDGVYNSPLGAVALQWFTKVKVVTQYPLAYISGGLVVSKKAFSALPPDYQRIFREVVDAKSKALTVLTRKENDEAMQALKENGLQFVDLAPQAVKELEEISRKVHQTLVGTLYSQELLDKAYKILADLRKK